jgi:hypothetical protein
MGGICKVQINLNLSKIKIFYDKLTNRFFLSADENSVFVLNLLFGGMHDRS